MRAQLVESALEVDFPMLVPDALAATARPQVLPGLAAAWLELCLAAGM